MTHLAAHFAHSNNCTFYFPCSFPVQSDIGLEENCEGAGADAIRSSILTQVTGVINREVKDDLNLILTAKYLGQVERYPASSCREILDAFPNSESGYYWLVNMAGQVFQAYCDMELHCGQFRNITGWMRVANVDLTDLTQGCPAGNFRLITGPNR